MVPQETPDPHGGGEPNQVAQVRSEGQTLALAGCLWLSLMALGTPGGL